MKWLLFSSVIVIAFVSQVQCDESWSSAEAEADGRRCYKLYSKQKEASNNCIATHFDQTAVTDEINKTLKDYNGDDAAVRELAVKYCPKLESAIPCLPIEYDVSDRSCDYTVGGPFKYNQTVLYGQVLQKLLNYACENNAETLVQAAHNGGFKTLDDKFRQCIYVTYEHKMVKEDAEVFEINPEYCTAQDQALRCYIETIESHKNENLVGIANAVFAIIREYIKCQQ